MQKRSSKKTENFLTKNIVGQNQEKPKISEQLDQIKKKLRWKSWKIIPVFLLTREPTTRFILQKKY